MIRNAIDKLINFNLKSLTNNKLVNIDQETVKKNSEALFDVTMEKWESCRELKIAPLKLKREFGGHFSNTQIEITDGAAKLKFGENANHAEKQQAQAYFNEHKLNEKIQSQLIQHEKCEVEYMAIRKEMFNYDDIVKYLNMTEHGQLSYTDENGKSITLHVVDKLGYKNKGEGEIIVKETIDETGKKTLEPDLDFRFETPLQDLIEDKLNLKNKTVNPIISNQPESSNVENFASNDSINQQSLVELMEESNCIDIDDCHVNSNNQLAVEPDIQNQIDDNDIDHLS